MNNDNEQADFSGPLEAMELPQQMDVGLMREIDLFIDEVDPAQIEDDMTDGWFARGWMRRVVCLRKYNILNKVETFSIPEYKGCDMTRKEKIDALLAYKRALITQCLAMLAYNESACVYRVSDGCWDLLREERKP